MSVLGMKLLHFSDNPLKEILLFAFWLNHRVAQFVSLTAMAPSGGDVLLTKPVLRSLNSLFTVYKLIFFSVGKSSQISVGAPITVVCT